MPASAGGPAAELVDVPVPAAGTYVVVVHGFETDGPDANYTLFTWTLGEPLLALRTYSRPAVSSTWLHCRSQSSEDRRPCR